MVREFLEQYKIADRKAKRLRREYEKEKNLIDSIESPLGSNGEPHGSGISKTVESRAIRLADKLLEYEDAELEAIAIRQTVFDMVMEVEGIEGDILYEKYINLKTWEDVAETVHVSTRAVYYLRKKAFKKIKPFIVLQSISCKNDSVER